MKSRIIPFAVATCLLASTVLKAEENADQEVFVSLTRTQIEDSKLPTNTDVVTQKEIIDMGIQNAGDALDSLAGVNIQKKTSLGSTRLARIRGFLNRQTAVFVDDRRVSPDVTGSIDLSQIPSEEIERIEIVRGAASVLYGANAEGGVINIITKRAKAVQPRVGASVTLKSYETTTAQAEGSYKKDRLEGFASGSRTRTDGFMKNSQFENTSFGGNVAYDFGLPGKTSVDFSVSRSQNGNPGGTPLRPELFDGDKERTPNSLTDYQKDNNDAVRLEHKARLAEFGEHGIIEMIARLSGSESKRTAYSSSITTSSVNTRSAFVQLNFPFGFTMGAEYERSFISSPYSKVPQTNGWGVFFQENFSYKALTVIPGVRYDNNTEWGNTTNPRLALIFQPVKAVKLSANVGSAFQAPSFSNFTDYHPVTGLAVARTQPGPFPEKSWQYDFGFEIQPVESLAVKTTLFRADIKDRLAFQSSGLGGTTKNLQDSYNQGVEAEVSQKIGEVFSHSINYTFLDSMGKGLGTDPNEFVELRYTPPHRLNYLTAVKLVPVDAELGSAVQYVSQQYNNDNRRGLLIPDYTVWNLSLKKKIGWAEVRIGVDNVLERRYVQSATEGYAGFTPDLYFAQPGRTYWGTVSVKLF